jgi:hypothetical protein
MKNILINIVKSIKVINIEMLQNKCSRAKGRLTIVEHFNDLTTAQFLLAHLLLNLFLFL